MQRQAAFRAYGSIEESVNDFANLLKNSPRYARTVAAGPDAARPGGRGARWRRGPGKRIVGERSALADRQTALAGRGAKRPRPLRPAAARRYV